MGYHGGKWRQIACFVPLYRHRETHPSWWVLPTKVSHCGKMWISLRNLFFFDLRILKKNPDILKSEFQIPITFKGHFTFSECNDLFSKNYYYLCIFGFFQEKKMIVFKSLRIFFLENSQQSVHSLYLVYYSREGEA